MCNTAVANYFHSLGFVPECFMPKKLCDKAVNTYPTTIKFAPECFMTQEMRDKAVSGCFLYLILFLINVNTRDV